MNETLREAGHATVIVEEQVAARMYTGPMYMKYNLVLRGMGAGRHTKIHEEYERVCKLNTYAPEHASDAGRRTSHARSPTAHPAPPPAATQVHDDAARDQLGDHQAEQADERY